jgi:hypothetical protein
VFNEKCQFNSGSFAEDGMTGVGYRIPMICVLREELSLKTNSVETKARFMIPSVRSYRNIRLGSAKLL